MVHSNGTLLESQRFRMDFTGNTKYSGRSADFLLVSAGNEVAARRAMPTSRADARSLGFAVPFRTRPCTWLCVPCTAAGRSAVAPEKDTGGQSCVWRSEMSLRQPANA